MHFENIGVHILPESPEIMHDALHLYRAFEHTRWGYRFRFYWSEPRDAEFVLFITIAPLPFPFRHGILTGGECKAVNMRDQIFGGQIDHTLARANEIVRGLAHLSQTQHATPAQPPCGRHRCQIGGSIWIQRADEHDGSSEIENGWFDRLVHEQTISDVHRACYPHLALKLRSIEATYQTVTRFFVSGESSVRLFNLCRHYRKGEMRHADWNTWNGK